MSDRSAGAAPMEKHLFLRVLGSFASGVTVITVTGKDGVQRGFTASAVSSLSLEPRMLLVCINSHSSTLEMLQDAGSFCVNILSSTQQEVAQQFAARSDNRFAGIRWRPGPATGAPVLQGTLAYAECVMASTCEGGDHVIVMGEVVGGDAYDAEPLLYFRGRYGTYGAVVAPVVHPADIWEVW